MRDAPDLSWPVEEADIEALEIGAGILGTGGGGNPYIGKLRAREVLRAGHRMRVLPLEALADDAHVMALGGIGAPLISFERIKEGSEGVRCLRTMEAHTGRRVDAIACAEIGGQNSMEPLIVAALAGLPVVDGDGMGRAFPEMQMNTFSIYGHRSTPSVMCDLHGNVVIFEHAVSELWHERMARACVISQGGSSVLAEAPMTGAFVRRHAVPGTYGQAIRLGRAVMAARAAHADPISAILAQEGGELAFTAKIVDLERVTRGGFNHGIARMEGLDAFAGAEGRITIQNEYLIFHRDGEVAACVPDLVIVLDLDTGLPITTELLRYGQRVAVIALPCHALLRTPEALEVIGPGAFGYPEISYRPLAGRAA